MKRIIVGIFSLLLFLSGCNTTEGQETSDVSNSEDIESLRPDELIKENYNYFQYDTLMRQPEELKAQQIHVMSAHIFQVLEDYEEDFNMYLATLGSSGDIIALAIRKEFMETRIIEDDEVAIYGLVSDPFVYESSSDIKKEVPLVFIDYYEILN